MINASSRYELLYEGIQISKDITEGVVIAEVATESPSYKAGLEIGDVIIKVGNHKVKDIAEFRYRLYNHDINETIDLTINRNGKEKVLQITLGSSK